MQSYIYTPISGAGGNVTEATGINSGGQVVGYYKNFTNSVPSTGFLYADGAAAPILPPGAASAQALGIDPDGVIVGSYATKDAGYGFIDDHGQYTTLGGPGVATVAFGINASGVAVGESSLSNGTSVGFIYDDGTTTQIFLEDAHNTYALGINDLNQVAGYANVPTGGGTYFIYDHGTYTTIAPPSGKAVGPGQSTEAINDRGELVGSYVTDAGTMGFIYDHGSYTTLAVPTATNTTAIGLNSTGAVVGTYTTGGSEHGFAYANGQYATIDVLGASTTVPLEVNDLGEVVGYYTDSSGTHGFAATPAYTLQPGTTTVHSHQADGKDYIFAGASQNRTDLPVMSFVHNSSNTLGAISVGTVPTSPHYYGAIKQGKQSFVRIASGIKVTDSTLLIDQVAGAKLVLDGNSALNGGTISASAGTLVLDGTITLGPGPVTLLDLDKEKLQGHGTVIQQGESGTIRVGRVAPGVKFQIAGGVMAIDDPLSFKGTIGPLPYGNNLALGIFGEVDVYQAYDTARATFDTSTGVLALLNGKGRDLADIQFSGNVSGLHLTKLANPSVHYIAINDQGTQGIGVGGNIPVSLVS